MLYLAMLQGVELSCSRLRRALFAGALSRAWDVEYSNIRHCLNEILHNLKAGETD